MLPTGAIEIRVPVFNPLLQGAGASCWPGRTKCPISWARAKRLRSSSRIRELVTIQLRWASRMRKSAPSSQECPDSSPEGFIFPDAEGGFMDTGNYRRRVLHKLAKETQSYSEPTHSSARSLRLCLYVRVTKYSFPPFTRSLYSPVGKGWISSTAEIFTTTERWMRIKP
jgi:hypothetical protein